MRATAAGSEIVHRTGDGHSKITNPLPSSISAKPSSEFLTIWRNLVQRITAHLDRRRLIAAEIMGRVYRRLLERIEASGFDVFAREIRVPRLERVWIAASTTVAIRAAR
jgi:hypothetical protein